CTSRRATARCLTTTATRTPRCGARRTSSEVSVHRAVMVLSARSFILRRMARPRQFDPDDVVDRSMHEFWARGYRDTTVDDLVQATGVRPGSLYGAFEGGKRQLFLEALKLYSRLVVPE